MTIAGAIARAASRADVIIESLVPDLLHDDELRAALSVRATSSPLAAAAAPEGSAA
jgi:hypothetical protein